MKKKWLIGGLVLGGIATVLAARRRGKGGYDEDEIDAAGEGDTFGERDGAAPAQTETGATAEALSMTARVETAWPAIQNVWPSLSLDDLRPAEGDLDRLADTIAAKVSQPRDEVRQRLEGIIAQETPDPSYPAH
jgi:hypothetical protein